MLTEAVPGGPDLSPTAVHADFFTALDALPAFEPTTVGKAPAAANNKRRGAKGGRKTTARVTKAAGEDETSPAQGACTAPADAMAADAMAILHFLEAVDPNDEAPGAAEAVCDLTICDEDSDSDEIGFGTAQLLTMLDDATTNARVAPLVS